MSSQCQYLFIKLYTDSPMSHSQSKQLKKDQDEARKNIYTIYIEGEKTRTLNMRNTAFF